MKTFSIIVPVYNHERYIGAALDSLIAQTDPDWEAVVVDDGSTDGTPAIVDDYARRDPRIRVIHKPNGGVSTALNVGLDQARGSWIGWLSSDDLFEPHKLSLHREWFGQQPDKRFFFTDFSTLEDATGWISTAPILHPPPEPRWQTLELLRGVFIYGITVCVHREAFAEAGRFNEGFRYGQDHDMWLRLLSRHEAVYIPERTAIARMHARQIGRVEENVTLYDCGRAGIAFLNGRRFRDVFPRVTLDEEDPAREAFERAMDVCAYPYAFQYAMGVHPGLIRLILDWVKRDKAGRSFAAEFGRRARGAAASMEGTPLGFLWKGAAAVLEASEAPGAGERRADIDPFDVCRCLWRRKRMRGEAVEPTMQYLSRSGARVPAADEGTAHGGGADVLIACPEGDEEWKEIARKLARQGHRVLAVGPEGGELNFEDGVLTAALVDTWRTSLALAAAGPFDVAAGPAGTRLLRWPVARRVIQGQAGVVGDEVGEAANAKCAWPRRPGLPNSAAKWGARAVRRLVGG